MIEFRMPDVLHSQTNGLFLPVWISLFVCAASSLFYALSQRVRKVASVPIVAVSPNPQMTLKEARAKFYGDGQKMLLEGHIKFKGEPFYVPTPLGERLMIPAKYIEELKQAPIDEVDFVEDFRQMFEGRYTTMGSPSTLHPRVARLQLNQNMESILAPIRDEINTAFDDEVPVTEDWTEVALADKFHRIVSRASSRMFGGIPLARDEAWLKATLDFATDGFIGAQKIKQYPSFIRPIVSKFIPEITRIPKHYDIVRNSVGKVLKARGYQPGKPINSKRGEVPQDFLQWMMEDAKDEEQDPNFLGDILLKISFAALHTSAASPMQLVYDLCEYPEYIAPLRKEIEEVMAEHSHLGKRALGKLKKMDSFMKESLRFNPLLLVTFQRKVTVDYPLSDGFVIPAGTFIGSASQALAMDPKLYPDPSKFDGFRHEKILDSVSNDPAAAGKTKWASANLESMAFGYGRHACPGRFFADYEIKLIMVHLLMTYDIERSLEQKGRPENFMAEAQMIPNHDAKVRMRRRRT